MMHSNPTSPLYLLFRSTPTPSQQEPGDDTTKAIKRALSDNDIQTIFFVNLITDHDDKSIVSNLNASHCYLTTEVEREIYDRVQRNDLPSDTSLSAGFERGASRVEVLGDLLRKVSWVFVKCELPFQEKQLPSDKTYHQTKACLYQEIRKHLMASSLSHGIYTRLESVAKTIAEMIVLSGDSSPQRKRFGVLVTSPGDRGPLSPRVLRYNQFEFDPVGLYLRSSLYVAQFVEDNFKGVRKGSTMDPRGFELVQGLTDQRSIDVYLPCPYVSNLWRACD
ncbi:hypothetical protein BO85DRAFT_518294 [Aspergillus piperis CBS 112811]|uniref:Uncharacterized protein n=1 Tax=Aspergillus piperis CBS 112811 TaxID=1448313 RepID=A0A8G1VN28_9EURO|nr:hypothetical protein BO85DRAFT_518294 [Aspergillus piperis CBS 112811]RAH59464.1 hypothetical protein BO85DRAFT_518294 [Aspergillus piperis CBS 112811]